MTKGVPSDSPRGEFEWIAELRRAVGSGGNSGSASGVVCGIGDDAAVLEPPAGHELVATTDLLVEGHHFQLDSQPESETTPAATPEQVGWKALAVSISDVAAMGGRSLWALVSVGLPPTRRGAFADGLLAGLLECAKTYGVTLVGGDTTGSPGPVVANVALVGSVPSGAAVGRDGARDGDAICVTGALGGSLLGRHLRPVPRQDAAAALVQGGDVHAMIDLSDGLSSDLGHLLDASGVGAVVWESAVPVHADARRMSEISGRPALEHALHDGEDFELLFTVPAARAGRLVRDGAAGVPVSHIGTIRRAPGCELRADPDATAGRSLRRQGYDHFGSA